MKSIVESPQGNFFSPIFKQRTSRYRAQGISDLNKHRPIRVPIYTPDWREVNVGRIFCSVRAGFDPGIPRSRVLSLTTRLPSPFKDALEAILFGRAEPFRSFRQKALWRTFLWNYLESGPVVQDMYYPELWRRSRTFEQFWQRALWWTFLRNYEFAPVVQRKLSF